MEFTGAYPKADLFDFALTQEDIVLHNNFPWSRKSMGIFNNNNGASLEEASGGEAGGGPKEANNNHLLPQTDSLPSFSDHTFWSKSAKMETAPLEDLGEICWSSAAPEEPKRCGDEASDAKVCESKGPEGNTDGAIYTLTVVNGETTSSSAAATAAAVAATWYRPPDLADAMDPQDNGIGYQQSLDIESIISILPTLPSMDHNEHPNEGLYDSHGLFGASDSSTELLAPSKLAPHACDDSGFVESKEEGRLKATTSLDDAGPPFSENNNDWSFSSNENRHNAESLLRSALQGGKSFLTQYNGCAQQQQQAQTSQQGQPTAAPPPQQRPQSDKGGTLKCMDTHTELQSTSVFSPGPGPGGTGSTGAPTGSKTPPDHASLGIYISEPHLIPVTMDSGSVLMFDDSTNQNLMYSSSHPNAPTSSQSMDEILLSPLQDYEKLKLIENEVAESAKHYSSLEHSSGYGVGGVHLAHMPDTMGTPALSSTKSTTKKKSGKKNGERAKGAAGQAKGAGGAMGGIAAATNGVRRERSLHHCAICSKAFKDKYSVNVHIRTHTGEKPFACSVCGKSFRQKAHLAKHYHTHIVQKTPDQSSAAKTVPGKSR